MQGNFTMLFSGWLGWPTYSGWPETLQVLSQQVLGSGETVRLRQTRGLVTWHWMDMDTSHYKFLYPETVYGLCDEWPVCLQEEGRRRPQRPFQHTHWAGAQPFPRHHGRKIEIKLLLYPLRFGQSGLPRLNRYCQTWTSTLGDIYLDEVLSLMSVRSL